MSDNNIELARLEFEREKWLAEQRLRERAQTNADAEIELKRLDFRQSHWRSPLVVAVFAAAVAATGNAVVALVNGILQRDLELQEAQNVDALERAKAEASRILEMIKTGDPETAAGNLQFLVDAGLVDDPQRLQRLVDFLSKRQPGSGPSLPASTAQYQFEQSEALTSQIADELDEHLQGYIVYLSRIGFDMGQSERVTIRIEEAFSGAYYEPEERALVIGSDFATDPEASLRELSHHVLVPGDAFPAAGDEMRDIESGLADYFVCSFRGDPAFGEIAARVMRIGPHVRNLDNQSSYDELADVGSSKSYFQRGEVWGGAFWEMRNRVGAELVDSILARAWRQVIGTSDSNARGFIAALLDSAREEPGDTLEEIESVLQRRNFPIP